MERRLKAMESKVIHGDVNLVEKQEELEKKMTEQQEEFKKQIEQETEQQRRINELEDMQNTIDEQFANVQEELEIKGRKIKRLVTLYVLLSAPHPLPHTDHRHHDSPSFSL